MELNRIVQPVFKTIGSLDIPVPQKINLKNGIETYFIKAGTQEVVKIDLVFNAGSWFQTKPAVASTVNEMLLEGTEELSSMEIAEKLDFYGAFIHQRATKDFGNITLFTLKKHLPATIQLLADVIKNPIFPEGELTTFLNKKKQIFQVDLEKVMHIARRESNQQIFGKNHPYGIKTEIEDYDKISRNDILEFHSRYYHSKNCKIITSGQIDDSVINHINENFGKSEWGNTTYIFKELPKQLTKIKPFSFVPKNDVAQSAIRLGKQVINRDDSDFYKLEVVNTLLGGYFGSRLMKNIREEKGYTYGIGSVLVSLKHAAYFIILSEVGSKFTDKAIDEILLEVKKMRSEMVSTEELKLVKNYMLGDLMRSFDGAFEIAANFKNIIELELDINYFHNQMETIRSITSEEVMDVANKYLHEETLVKTIAGKYK